MRTYFSAPVVVLFTSVLISGCAGVLNVGESEFACPGVSTNGLKCMGVRDLYKATDGPMSSFGNKASSSSVGGSGSEVATADKGKLQSAEDRVGYEPTPWMDKPMPIRSQARVMRIWVAPFEDEVGDLNAPGMVFTEIESRRWNVGEGLVKRPMRLAPVKVSSPGVQGSESGASSSSSPFAVTNASGQQAKGLRNVTVGGQDDPRSGPGAVPSTSGAKKGVVAQPARP